jgi:hypothetical protein
VIVVTPSEAVEIESALTPGAAVRMGQAIGSVNLFSI